MRCSDHCPTPGRGGGWLLFVVVSTVMVSSVGAVAVKAGSAAEGIAYAVFETTMLVLGCAGLAAAAAFCVWMVVDEVRSRAAVRRFRRSRGSLGGVLMARKAPVALPIATPYRADAVRVDETENEVA